VTIDEPLALVGLTPDADGAVVKRAYLGALLR
jgi:hypothetical protein